MNDILDGYYRKLKREDERLIFQVKAMRKAAFISVMPHVKKLTEKKFNNEIWPIDEAPEKEIDHDRVKRMGEGIRKYNLKLSEARRKKQKQ